MRPTFKGDNSPALSTRPKAEHQAQLAGLWTRKADQGPVGQDEAHWLLSFFRKARAHHTHLPHRCVS